MTKGSPTLPGWIGCGKKVADMKMPPERHLCISRPGAFGKAVTFGWLLHLLNPFAMNRLAVFLLFLFVNTGLFAQADTIPPHLECRSNPIFNFNLVCQLPLNAADLLDSLSDNQLPGLPLELGIRKLCTGAGFPENQDAVLFRISEIGGGGVELWARDAAGNTSTCQTYVFIFDQGFCDPASTVQVKMPDQRGIAGVSIEARSVFCTGDSSTWPPFPVATDQNGYWSALGQIIGLVGADNYVTPSKKNAPTNGVTTFDLLEIQKHILGTKLLDSPYKMLAADANLDGKVSLQDVVLLQKLVLGLIPEMPHGKSWRFVPEDYIFDPANPLAAPQQIVAPHTADPIPASFNFTGVKIGDVNYSVDPK